MMKNYQTKGYNGVGKNYHAIGNSRPSDVIGKIRDAILISEHPEALPFMRGIDALKQAFSR
jgi:hypothetical protein